MNHQQFEKWILLERELKQEQQRELNLHLKSCSHCQALYQSIHQLDHLFRTAPEPQPAPNFSARWLDRIQKVEQRRNRLILGTTLSVMSLATLILLSVVGLELRSALEFFPQMLLRLITLIAEWLVFFNQLSNFISPLIRVGSKIISPVWMTTLAVSLGGIAAVWIYSLLRSKSLQEELNQ